MTNEEKTQEIVIKTVTDPTIVGERLCAKVGAIEMAEWKDRQFKEYLSENLSDIIFECIEEYKTLKGSLNDNGTMRNDYLLAQDIAITCEAKIINEFFKKN